MSDLLEAGRKVEPNSWRASVRRVINDLVTEGRGKGLAGKELEKFVRAGYPFGERKYWPYKVWLEEVRFTCSGIRPPTRKQKPRERFPRWQCRCGDSNLDHRVGRRLDGQHGPCTRGGCPCLGFVWAGLGRDPIPAAGDQLVLAGESAYSTGNQAAERKAGPLVYEPFPKDDPAT